MSIRAWAKRAFFGEPATAAWRGKANGVSGHAVPGAYAETIGGGRLDDRRRSPTPLFFTEEGPMTAREYAAARNAGRLGGSAGGRFMASADDRTVAFFENARGVGHEPTGGDHGGTAADDDEEPPPVLRWRCETDDRSPVFIYARTMIDAKEKASDHFGVWDAAVDVALAPLEDEVVTMQDGRAAPGS